MSDSPQTQDPRDDDKGTFVGGSFGKPSLDKDSHEETTAQQVEAEHDGDSDAPVAAPAEAQETIDDAETSSVAATDVEGTSTEPAPGERNEPV